MNIFRRIAEGLKPSRPEHDEQAERLADHEAYVDARIAESDVPMAERIEAAEAEAARAQEALEAARQIAELAAAAKAAERENAPEIRKLARATMADRLTHDTCSTTGKILGECDCDHCTALAGTFRAWLDAH